jgi:CrcB protein
LEQFRSPLPLVGDAHPELPIDPDGGPERPLHLRPIAVLLVAGSGMVGAAARIGAGVTHPSPAETWPWTTFAVNLIGAFLLGGLLEALARAGADTGWRQRVRLLAGTGFCGAFTTYSTLAVEVDLLARDGRVGTALLYLLSTVGIGAVCTTAGIGLAAGAHRRVRA